MDRGEGAGGGAGGGGGGPSGGVGWTVVVAMCSPEGNMHSSVWFRDSADVREPVWPSGKALGW